MDELPTKPCAKYITHYLKRNFVFSPGSQDIHQNPVIFFSDNYDEGITPTVLDSILDYFFHLNPCRHLIVIDRRGSGWIPTKKLLIHLNLNYLDHIEYVVLLRPQGFFQRLGSDRTVASIYNDISFELKLIDNPSDLFDIIPACEIPSQVDGELFFDVSLWVDFQIVSTYQSHCFKA
nr:dbl [Hymenolepis microstoma]